MFVVFTLLSMTLLPSGTKRLPFLHCLSTSFLLSQHQFRCLHMVQHDTPAIRNKVTPLFSISVVVFALFSMTLLPPETR